MLTKIIKNFLVSVYELKKPKQYDYLLTNSIFSVVYEDRKTLRISRKESEAITRLELPAKQTIRYMQKKLQIAAGSFLEQSKKV